MLTIDKAVFLTRCETADLLCVSIHTLEVWRSVERHRELHVNFFKFKGRTCYYKLDDIKRFLKTWNLLRYYELYPE